MEPGSAVSAVRRQRVFILPDSEASVQTAGKGPEDEKQLKHFTIHRNSIPSTTTLQNFHEKLRAATGQCFVDTAFWGGVITGNKCFLIHSAVDEFPHVSDADVHAAMKQLQGTGSMPQFHAERDVQHPAAEKGNPHEYSIFLRSRPGIMESAFSILIIRVRCHIVHLSSAQPLEIIRSARKAGAPLTVETTHHYLNPCEEYIPACATQFKCCPLILDMHSNFNQFLCQELLCSALKAGDIDMVVSGHSSCSGDFSQAWGGISSLQFGLSLFWTSASKRGFSFVDAVRLLCREPAQLCHLDNQKGSLIPGHDADLIIWDPEKEFTVNEDKIHYKNKLTPHLGLALRGKVKATIVRGKVVYSHGSFSSQALRKHLCIQHKTPAPL
uniref:Zgc:103559 n=1 Tax=Cyprinus carpio TaxID=7962 RepID=A0A8C1GLC3_CYPCA